MNATGARCPDLIQIREYNLIITLFVKTNGLISDLECSEDCFGNDFLKPVSYSLLLASSLAQTDGLSRSASSKLGDLV